MNYIIFVFEWPKAPISLCKHIIFDERLGRQATQQTLLSIFPSSVRRQTSAKLVFFRSGWKEEGVGIGFIDFPLLTKTQLTVGEKKSMVKGGVNPTDNEEVILGLE